MLFWYSYSSKCFKPQHNQQKYENAHSANKKHGVLTLLSCTPRGCGATYSSLSFQSEFMLSSQGNAPGLFHLGLTGKARQKLNRQAKSIHREQVPHHLVVTFCRTCHQNEISLCLPRRAAEDPPWPFPPWQNPGNTALQTPCPRRGNTGLGAQLHSQHLLLQLGHRTETWEREQNLGILGNGGEVRANRLKMQNYFIALQQPHSQSSPM